MKTTRLPPIVPALALFALLATCVLHLALFATPTAQVLRADDATAAQTLYRLGELEAGGDRPFRWSAAGWRLALYGLDRRAPVLVQIDLSAARPAEVPAPQLRVHGDQTQFSFSVDRPWRTYQFLAAPTAPRDGPRQILFSSDVFTPTGETNARALGVAVAVARIQSLPVAPGLEPRALFFLLLALLIVLATRKLGVRLALAAGSIVMLLAALLLWGAAARLGYWVPDAWGLLALGYLVLGLLALEPRLLPPVAALRTGDALITRRVWLLSLAAVFGLALLLRVTGLESLPPALWRDEARHGLFALQIWQDPSYRPVYEPAVDLPAGILYLIAPFVGLLGPDLVALRLPVALAGALAPLALVFALEPLLGRRRALLGGLLMAFAMWALYQSRWAMPPMLDLLCTCGALGAALRATQAGSLRTAALWSLAAGAVAGLALYTYHTGRLTPLLVALVAFPLRRDRRFGVIAGSAALALVLVALPLIQYAVTSPELFNRRVGRVNVTRAATLAPQPPLLRVQENVLTYAQMWHVRGDSNARHFAPDRPMLDVVSGAGFAVGVLLALWGARERRLVIWLALGLVPAVFSGDAPHAMRAIGALAPTCALVAVGLGALPGGRSGRAALVIGLAIALGLNVTTYWRAASNPADVVRKFDYDETVIARALRAAVRDGLPVDLYLWENTADKDVTRFLTADVRDQIGRFDGARLNPAPTRTALLLIPGDVTPAKYAAALAALGPGAAVVREGPIRLDTFKRLWIVLGAGPDAVRVAGELRIEN